MNQRLRPRVARDRCPFCHEELGADGLKQGCPSCMAWHHRECWAENGATCAACGFEVGGVAAEPAAVDAKFAALLRSWRTDELRRALTVYREDYDPGQRQAIDRELERRPDRAVRVGEGYAGALIGYALFVVVLFGGCVLAAALLGFAA